MELVIVSVGVLLALVVTAAVMDVRARRTRRLMVDPDGVRDARWRNQAQADLQSSRDPGTGMTGPGSSSPF